MRNPTALVCDIKHFSVHDGPGIRTTLFLKGCPLHCLWCHNPESIDPRPQLGFFAERCTGCGACAAVCSCHRITTDGRHEFDRESCTACGKCVDACLFDALELYGRELTLEEAVATVLEDRVFYAVSGGGVTLSGGEPLLQADFGAELFKLLKQEAIDTAVDTCGQVPWSSFERILPWTDRFLYDFKHADSATHRTLTGSGNEQIKANLARLSQTGVPIEIRMPLIPGLNTDDTTIEAAGEFLSTLPNITAVRLLPYHNLAHSKYAAVARPDTLPDTPSPGPELLAHAAELLQTHGLQAIHG